jgi:hypothetical protein
MKYEAEVLINVVCVRERLTGGWEKHIVMRFLI